MILQTKCGRSRVARIVAMGGQITHKPRNFVNRIDDIWVKSLYNEKNVVYLLQWDDRTKSVAEGKLPVGSYPGQRRKLRCKRAGAKDR